MFSACYPQDSWTMSFSCCFTRMQGGAEYTSWSRYRAFYSTPDADRDYLQYWETIVKEINVCLLEWSASSSLELCSVFLFSWTNNVCSWQWLEQYLLTNESSIEVCIFDLSKPWNCKKSLYKCCTTTITYLFYYLVGAYTFKGHIPSM